jgi:hypothetical protein
MDLRGKVMQQILFAGQHRMTNIGYYTNRPKEYPQGKVLDGVLAKDEKYVLGKYADEIIKIIKADDNG